MPQYSYQYSLTSLFDQGSGVSTPAGVLLFTATSTVNASIIITKSVLHGFSNGFDPGFDAVGEPDGVNWTKDDGAITYVPFVGADATVVIPHSGGASFDVLIWAANSAADLLPVSDSITGFNSVDDKLTSLDISFGTNFATVVATEAGGGGLLGFLFDIVEDLVTIDLTGSDLVSIDVSDVVATSFVFDMTDSLNLTEVRCIGVTTDATLDFVNCDLDVAALNQIFDDLANGTGTIDITGATGELGCNVGVAEGKGYTIVRTAITKAIRYTTITGGLAYITVTHDGTGATGFNWRETSNVVHFVPKADTGAITLDMSSIDLGERVIEIWPATDVQSNTVGNIATVSDPTGATALDMDDFSTTIVTFSSDALGSPTLVAINLVGFTALTSAYCSEMRDLVTFNASNCTSLTYIEVWSNPAAETINVSGCTALVEMDTNDCTALKTVDIGACNALDNLLDLQETAQFVTLSAAGFGTDYGSSKSSVAINLTNSGISGTALDAFYTQLLAGTGWINITGATGAGSDTPTIATGKGYTIVGS